MKSSKFFGWRRKGAADDAAPSTAEKKTPAKPRQSELPPAPKKSKDAAAPAANTSSFAELGLSAKTCKAVADEGYENPTPIQSQCIPIVLSGRDLLGLAQTGTGKTAAFALPIIDRLMAQPSATRGTRALILTPTRELAVQVADSFKTYGKYGRLNTVMIFGGVGIEPQKQAMRRQPDIVVATPGRLLDLASQRCVDFRNLDVFILDEADRMLDMGFLPDVKRIIKLLPEQRQNLLFSATMPDDIQDLVSKLLRDPARVTVAPRSSTSAQIEQRLYLVERPFKRHLLLETLQQQDVTRALVFTRTKAIANRISEFLTKSGVGAEAIHGNKSQSARQRSLENFRSGRIRVLVASDLAARGIDIDEISHVINYDIPNEPETYVHRIGRTGRAQATGIALSFCDMNERAFVRDIERIIGKRIPLVEEHPYAGMEDPNPAPPEPQRSRQRGGRGGSQGGDSRPQSRGSRSTGGSSRSSAGSRSSGGGSGGGSGGRGPRKSDGQKRR